MSRVKNPRAVSLAKQESWEEANHREQVLAANEVLTKLTGLLTWDEFQVFGKQTFFRERLTCPPPGRIL